MPIRHYAQRKHIITSLDSLLYQLHTLSFILAPSILAYVFRCATQLQFSRARDLDGNRSLGFWYFIIFFVNLGSIWTHAAIGVPDGKSVVLDFVGMGRRPTKVQLLSLDFTIILLQIILTTISYETSLTLAMPEEEPDPLVPLPTTSEVVFESPNESEERHLYPPSSPSQSPSSSSVDLLAIKPTVHLPPGEPVIVLTLHHVLQRLRHPAPVPPEQTNASLEEVLSLPLPNTTASRLSQTLRLLAQTRALRRELDAAIARQAALGAEANNRNGRDSNSVLGNDRRNAGGEIEPRLSRIPGAIDADGLG